MLLDLCTYDYTFNVYMFVCVYSLTRCLNNSLIVIVLLY